MNNLSLKNGEPNENGTASLLLNLKLVYYCVFDTVSTYEETLYEIAE